GRGWKDPSTGAGRPRSDDRWRAPRRPWRGRGRLPEGGIVSSDTLKQDSTVGATAAWLLRRESATGRRSTRPNASRQGMANRLLGGGFQDVDRTGTPEAFAKYLEHIGTDERVRRLNRKRAEAAGIAAGHRLLDVGCGVGFDASLLAELVAPAGKVIGIDHSAAMVERAAARLAGSGLPVEFRTADAHALPFDDCAFDAAWTGRVLLVVTVPAQSVPGMIRPLRPACRLLTSGAE